MLSSWLGWLPYAGSALFMGLGTVMVVIGLVGSWRDGGDW
jgi:hypothetical protein